MLSEAFVQVCWMSVTALIVAVPVILLLLGLDALHVPRRFSNLLFALVLLRMVLPGAPPSQWIDTEVFHVREVVGVQQEGGSYRIALWDGLAQYGKLKPNAQADKKSTPLDDGIAVKLNGSIYAPVDSCVWENGTFHLTYRQTAVGSNEHTAQEMFLAQARQRMHREQVGEDSVWENLRALAEDWYGCPAYDPAAFRSGRRYELDLRSTGAYTLTEEWDTEGQTGANVYRGDFSKEG